jgi:hypothetical protein
VQELLTQDKVDAIVGFSYSPDAIASAPVISAGKKLAVIANAGTSFITNLSPDFVRTSFTMWHSADYPPGKDSLEAFKNAFEASGGKVIDGIPATSARCWQLAPVPQKNKGNLAPIGSAGWKLVNVRFVPKSDIGTPIESPHRRQQAAPSAR